MTGKRLNLTTKEGIELLAESAKYKNSAIDHYLYCRELLEGETTTREYFYAALELRFCLERLCFEYLVLLGRPLSKRERKYYKPKDFLNRLRKEIPHLERHVTFFDAVCEETNISKADRMICPDADWFQKTYGELGTYLHSIRGDVEQDFISDLVETVQKCYKEIPVYLKGRGNIRNMPPTTLAVYNDYVNGVLDEESMKKRLELTKN